jgi:alpha-L-rhamnosidase
VHMPMSKPESIMESGKPLSALPQAHDVHACGVDTCFELDSGRYRFSRIDAKK